MTGSKSTRLSTGTSSTSTKTQPSTTSSMSEASTSSQTPSTSSQTPSPSSQTPSTSSQTPSTSSQTQSTPSSRKQELEEQRKTIKEEEEREFQLLGELGDEDGDDYEEEKETKDESSSATSGIKYYRGRLPEHQFKKIQENKVDLAKEIQWCENLIKELVSYQTLNDEHKQQLGSIQTEQIKSLITILLHCDCPKAYCNFLKSLIKLEFHRPVRMLEPNHEIWQCCIKHLYRADEYDFNQAPDSPKNKEFISRNEDNMNKFCEKAEAIPAIASVRQGSIEVTYYILVPKDNGANGEEIKAQMENAVNHGQIGDIPVMKEGFTIEKIEETEEDIEKDIQRRQAKIERLKRKRKRLEEKKKKKKETEDRDEITMDAIPVTTVLSEQPGPVTEIPTEQPIPKPSTSVETKVEPSSSTAKRLKRGGGIMSTFFPSKLSGKNKNGAESTPEIVEIPDTREKSHLKMEERLCKKPHEEMEMDDQQTISSTLSTATRKQELEAKRKKIIEEEEREFQKLRELGDEDDDDDDDDDDDEHAMEVEEEKTQIDSSTKSTPAPTAAQNRGKIPEEDFEKLQKNFSFLRDDIWPRDIIHVLFSKCVFNEDTKEQCKLTLDNKGRADCAEFLLESLVRARKDAFKMFIKILEETSHINSVRLLNPGSPLCKNYNPDERKFYRGRLPEHEFEKIQKNKFDLKKIVRSCESCDDLITALVSYKILKDEDEDRLNLPTLPKGKRIECLFTTLLYCGPRAYRYLLKALMDNDLCDAVFILDPNFEIYKCKVKQPGIGEKYDFNQTKDSPKNEEFIAKNEENMDKELGKDKLISGVSNVKKGCIEVTFLILNLDKNKTNSEDIKKHLENSVNEGKIGDIPVMKEGFTFEKIEETEEDIEKDIQRRQAKIERLKRKRERLEKKKKKKKQTEDRDETTMDAITPAPPVLSELPVPVTEIPTEQPIPKPSTSVEMEVEPSSSTALQKRLKGEGGIMSTFLPSKSYVKGARSTPDATPVPPVLSEQPEPVTEIPTEQPKPKPSTSVEMEVEPSSSTALQKRLKGAGSKPEVVEIPDTIEKSNLKMDERLYKKPHEEMEMDTEQKMEQIEYDDSKQGLVFDNIDRIKEDFSVDISFPEDFEEDENFIRIYGETGNVNKAKQFFEDLLSDQKTETYRLHTTVYETIIGPKGSQLQGLMSSYRVKLAIVLPNEPDNLILSISGPSSNVEKCKDRLDRIHKMLVQEEERPRMFGVIDQ